jgi:hypothetical protein
MKFLRVFLISLILLTAYACKEDVFSSGTSRDVEVTGGILQTRTAYTEAEGVMHVSWKANDAIGIYTSKQENVKYVASQDGASTTFLAESEKLDVEEGDTVFAYYPYFEIEDGVIAMSTPNPSRTSESDLMYATGVVKDGTVNFQFHHFFAFLKITVPKSELTGENFEIRNTSGQVIWEYFYTVENNELKFTGLSSHANGYGFTISYLESSDDDITFYTLILPQDGGQQMKFYSTSIDGSNDKLLCTKDLPEEGLCAGNVYTVSINNSSLKN